MKFREFERGVVGRVFRPISTGDSGVRSNQAWITGCDFLGWWILGVIFRTWIGKSTLFQYLTTILRKNIFLTRKGGGDRPHCPPMDPPLFFGGRSLWRTWSGFWVIAWNRPESADSDRTSKEGRFVGQNPEPLLRARNESSLLISDALAKPIHAGDAYWSLERIMAENRSWSEAWFKPWEFSIRRAYYAWAHEDIVFVTCSVIEKKLVRVTPRTFRDSTLGIPEGGGGGVALVLDRGFVKTISAENDRRL